jgi:hypothetical protein
MKILILLLLISVNASGQIAAFEVKDKDKDIKSIKITIDYQRPNGGVKFNKDSTQLIFSKVGVYAIKILAIDKTNLRDSNYLIYTVKAVYKNGTNRYSLSQQKQPYKK